jgi:hypothetical protein
MHAVVRIDLAHRRQPFHRQDDGPDRPEADLPADEASPAGIGHDPDPRLGAEPHGGGNAGGVPRAEDGGGGAGEAAARLLEERGSGAVTPPGPSAASSRTRRS